MKKLTLLLGLVLVSGTAMAQQDSSTSTKEKGTASEPALITEESTKVEAKVEDKSDKKKDASVMGAEVVSIDASSKTITVKEAASTSASASLPGTMTLPVQGKAVSALKDIKIGDFVDLTCKADKKADVSATASGTTATASVKADTTLSQCASVTAITKAAGSAFSSTSTSSTTSSSSPSSISSSSPMSSSSTTTTSSTSPSSSTTSSSTFGSPSTSASASTSAQSTVSAEVVSADQTARTITLKPSPAMTGASSRTLSVDSKAAALLKDLKSGDKVSVTCRATSSPSASVSGSVSGVGSASASASLGLDDCAQVVSISKSVASLDTPSSSAISSSSPSSSTSSSVGSPGGSMTADSSTSSTSSSISQGGTLTPDQATVDAEVKQRTSQPAVPPATSSTTTTTTTSSSKSTGSSTKLTAVIVSTDAAAKTITVKNPGQGKSTASASETSVDSLTLPVEGSASSKLADFKAGDRVSITCRESASAGASAMAGSDTGWSLGASRCVAATDIVKAKASASETDPASTKSKTTTDPQPAPQPKTY